MALGSSTSSRRLHPSCRLRMALAFAAVFAFAFFLGRAPAGTSAPSSSLDGGRSGKGAHPPQRGRRDRGTGLADSSVDQAGAGDRHAAVEPGCRGHRIAVSRKTTVNFDRLQLRLGRTYSLLPTPAPTP